MSRSANIMNKEKYQNLEYNPMVYPQAPFMGPNDQIVFGGHYDGHVCGITLYDQYVGQLATSIPWQGYQGRGARAVDDIHDFAEAMLDDRAELLGIKLD